MRLYIMTVWRMRFGEGVCAPIPVSDSGANRFFQVASRLRQGNRSGKTGIGVASVAASPLIRAAMVKRRLSLGAESTLKGK